MFGCVLIRHGIECIHFLFNMEPKGDGDGLGEGWPSMGQSNDIQGVVSGIISLLTQ